MLTKSDFLSYFNRIIQPDMLYIYYNDYRSIVASSSSSSVISSVPSSSSSDSTSSADWLWISFGARLAQVSLLSFESNYVDTLPNYNLHRMVLVCVFCHE